MKVERDTPFTPITIILETQEEADWMWHRLNLGGGMTWEDYCQRKGISKTSSYGYWDTFNRKYRLNQ